MEIIPLFIGLFLVIHLLFAQDIILKKGEFCLPITLYLRRCLKIIFGKIQFLFRIIWQLVSSIHASAEFVVFS